MFYRPSHSYILGSSEIYVKFCPFILHKTVIFVYWLRRICYKRWHTESEQVTDKSLGYFPLSLFDCYSRSICTQATFRITWNTTSSAGSSLYFLRYYTFFPHPSKNHFSHLFSSVLNHAASAAFPLFPLFFDAVGLRLGTLVLCEAAFPSCQVD